MTTRKASKLIVRPLATVLVLLFAACEAVSATVLYVKPGGNGAGTSWSDAADLVPAGSPAWWDAKERVVEIYVRANRRDQARKMLRTLWLTRSDASDPNRRARWERLVGAE
jgi:hypothetical protein